ncbi:xylose isomerase [Candidatus Aerophobetes bacterium Ae_b3a]|nr:MAG: xylose isomerase [Candidatus Aerophobetes bacterium Ae_b3a]
MKLGVLTALFGEQSLEKALDTIAEIGVEAVEFGTGNFVGNVHCNPNVLLESGSKLKEFKETVEKRGLFISAFSCHGNPLHPQEAVAQEHRQAIRSTILLAEELGVERINTFAGLPGSSDSDKYPNWVTCPWPTYFSEIVKWQWEEKIIPFWKEEVKFARAHKMSKICFEMHPGESVHSPEKLLKLRDAVGEEICCNFDPSHLFWQGIDPITAIKKLGESIQHVHAKDTRVDAGNTSLNGILDTKQYSDEANRSWIFRTVGYGHGYDFWKDLVSTLRLIGYDYVLSIEHEDSLMSSKEGLQKAVTFLKEVMLSEKPGEMWWA